LRRRLAPVALFALGSLAAATAARAESEAPLTLREAQEFALAHHPVLQAAELRARAAEQGIREARAAFFPQVTANATGVAAGDSTRIAASGGLNNPTVFQRESNGLLVSQLITDFGRTSNLTSSTRYQAESVAQTARATRAGVLLDVNRAFFGVLGAEALLRVAEGTVKARDLVLERVRALAEAKLKSGLDVSFAEVGLGEGRLLQLRAEARLRETLGTPDSVPRALAEEPLPGAPEGDVETLVRSAWERRPEMLAARAQTEGARRLASAEKAAQFPVIAALGAVGFSPYRDVRLSSTYGAAGINLSLPVFNGGRLSARQEGAELQATATERLSEEERNAVARDVRVAWLDAQTAYKAIAVTTDLRDSAQRALDLAQSRYDLGISSIVELSQAQLQDTEAEIAAASARYDYQIKRATLDFAVGASK
jgi:outer membrane protein